MTVPLEDRIRSVFEAHVATDNLDTVVSAAVRRGARIRRRRRVLAASAVALVLALAIALTAGRAVVLIFPPVTHHMPSPSPSPSYTAVPGAGDEPSWTTVPTPPAAPAGTPTAATDPAVLGSAPALLHFGFGPLPIPHTVVTWTSSQGVESASLMPAVQLYNEGSTTDVTLARDPSALAAASPLFSQPGTARRHVTVHGRPATLLTQFFDPLNTTRPKSHQQSGGYPVHAVRWQPAPTLWAQVASGSLASADLVRVAEAVRLDVTYRCVVPLRTSAPPPSTHVTGCHMSFTSRGAKPPTVTYGDGHGNSMDLRLGGPTATTEAKIPNSVALTVAGVPAYWWAYPAEQGSPPGAQLNLAGPHGRVVYCQLTGTAFTQADAIRATTALVFASSLTDPSTWLPAS